MSGWTKEVGAALAEVRDDYLETTTLSPALRHRVVAEGARVLAQRERAGNLWGLEAPWRQMVVGGGGVVGGRWAVGGRMAVAGGLALAVGFLGVAWGPSLFEHLASTADRTQPATVAANDPAGVPGGAVTEATSPAVSGTEAALDSLEPVRAQIRGRALPLGVTASARLGNETVRFTDGSTVEMVGRKRRPTRLKVTGTSPEGAVVELQRGIVAVDVVHRPRTGWTFVSGPFEVKVVGTRFTIDWQPETGAWALQMVEGEVVVSGRGLLPRSVKAGETLRHRAAPEGAVDSPKSVVRDDPDTTAPDEGAASDPPDAVLARPWWALANEGALDEAAAALRSAFATDRRAVEWNRATGEGLWRLGTRIRSDDGVLFEAILRALRLHHHESRFAASAAFELGVLTAPDNPTESARWFATFLSEAPESKLAPLAAGRWLEELARTEDRAAQRAAARDYLKRFPYGTHQRLADRLLEGEREAERP